MAEVYGVRDALAVMELVTGRGPRRRAFRSAALLLDCAAEGDELARERVVVGRAARTPPTCASAARACGLGEPTPITLAGGVMRHRSSLLVDALAEALPGCELRRARREPAHGALLAALDEGGAAPVALDDTALPADLFATARVP